MDQLERLSLVSKVCSELDNHFGIKDKDVAEFIIELATANNTFDKFKRALEEQGLGEQVTRFARVLAVLFFAFVSWIQITV